MATDKKVIDKRANFEKYVNKRLHNALVCIGRIEQLANNRYYEYTDQEYKKILNLLNQAIKNVKQKFENKQTAPKNKDSKIPNYII